MQSLLGPYLVFLCSTVNGYEGTGRALSLRSSSRTSEKRRRAWRPDVREAKGERERRRGAGRLLREVCLAEPVRYSYGDRIETWLNGLLCLDAADATPPLNGTLPPPSACDLFEVNRDTLFSAHRASEVFLKRMMSLYIASHYKNTPNDLQLMADAPAHRLFVLPAPVDDAANALPEILCVVQVALEGAISRWLPPPPRSLRATLRRATSCRGRWRRNFRTRTSPVSPARASFALRRTRICPARIRHPRAAAAARVLRGATDGPRGD